MRAVLEGQPRLTVKQATVEDLVQEGRQIAAVTTNDGATYSGRTVVITTGTFMNGLIHMGAMRHEAGRVGELPSKGLPAALARLNLTLGRLKTGTVPRLEGRSIAWEGLEEQQGDDPIRKFSFWDSRVELPQVSCFITFTNGATHKVIQDNLGKSAMYSGAIKGVGPRYCPSIEDKVVKFPDKERHQIFLEPTGLDTHEIYPNGLSTSLPPDVQAAFLRTIPGLERVEITRPGYAVEYDYVLPMQLHATLALKDWPNLFCAGQINGTSGYEEAAAQGLVAGINAALQAKGESPFVLRRDEGYIGVLVDDLITQGTEEPYRMFTSRAEYRILLREDTADLRLSEKGWRLGLLPEEHWRRTEDKRRRIHALRGRLTGLAVTPTPEVNAELEGLGQPPLRNGASAADLVRRPEMKLERLESLSFLAGKLGLADEPLAVREQVETAIKYEGYVERQNSQLAVFGRLEGIVLPEALEYAGIPGLSREVIQKLTRFRPGTLGQASRISGITPAAISLLAAYVRGGAPGRKPGSGPARKPGSGPARVPGTGTAREPGSAPARQPGSQPGRRAS
jgi:tRNA uridine 5-carboxymethylaminomethyl modification enzyme